MGEKKIKYERRKFAVLRTVYKMRETPGGDLEYRTPFTENQWKANPYAAVEGALGDEGVQGALESVTLDYKKRFNVEKAEERLKNALPVEHQGKAALLALYAYLHSDLHKPVLSAENAIKIIGPVMDAERAAGAEVRGGGKKKDPTKVLKPDGTHGKGVCKCNHQWSFDGDDGESRGPYKGCDQKKLAEDRELEDGEPWCMFDRDTSADRKSVV